MKSSNLCRGNRVWLTGTVWSMGGFERVKGGDGDDGEGEKKGNGNIDEWISGVFGRGGWEG